MWHPSPASTSDAADLERRLARLARGADAEAALAALRPQLRPALAAAASPDRALANLERLVEAAPEPASLFRSLTAEPHALEMLITLFSGSQFLSGILLRHPAYLARLNERGALAQIKTAAQFAAEVRHALAAPRPGADIQPALDTLRRYQRGELLRIGVCDLSALLDLSSVTAQLANLADAVVQVCLELTARQVGVSPDEFAVLGMGKLGGGELNYSSDIDLLFVSAANATVYTPLAERLIAALTQATAEGFLYRVDMRLRPWGQVGPLVATLEGYLAYLKRHARLWEKQALLKARVIAGSERVGETLLRWARPLLFDAPAEAVRAEVHAMKQQTEAHLTGQGRDWGEVKLGEGSIRDIEFVAQYLQLTHGAARPAILTPNTLQALARLADATLLSSDEHRILSDGYIFLRTVEHFLQMLDYRQTHTLPRDGPGLAFLARRLAFTGPRAAEQFLAQYSRHSAEIRSVYQRHLIPRADHPEPVQRGGQAMDDKTPISAGGLRASRVQRPAIGQSESPNPRSEVVQHLSRLSPSYAATFSEAEIARHAELVAQLTDRNPVEVVAEPLAEGFWRITIVAYDYLGELAMICGLLFAYGFSIASGNVYTYEPLATGDQGLVIGSLPVASPQSPVRKIVDTFTVHAARDDPEPDIAVLWRRYATDLAALLRLLQARRQREAQGELAKRVAVSVRGLPGATPTLHPITIEIDNDASDRHTVLRIGSTDTIGFLYELSNALALNDIYIAQVAVASVGNRVHDTLYITDAQGRKIVAAEKQRELRAATVLVKHFTHLLPYSPNPQAALLHFHQYTGELFRRPSWPDELASLERPEVLQALARLLGVSDFLWEDFLRMQYANLFPVVRDVDALAVRRTKEQLAAELAALGSEDWRDALNAFKDREMFRIDMRHIQGHITEIAQFSAELTDLAEVVMEAALHGCEAELQAQYGAAQAADGRPIGLVVCALGKCGGREMGYASDIELMFIYSGSGMTTGPRVVSAAEYYDLLAREIVRAIRAHREGIFEIDLQLRPYGKAGSLAAPLDAFRRYFAAAGPAWSYERQALVRLRPIAGDAALADQIHALRDQFVYSGAAFDVAAMRAMRERQLRHLVTPGTINAKFSQGGLVDVEYIVQALQMGHGHEHPALRSTNTREAMAALAQAGIISDENRARLHEAHIFLQRLIDALRVVRGNSKDLSVPPSESEEFAFLARRLGYGDDPMRLRVDLSERLAAVQRLSARLLG